MHKIVGIGLALALHFWYPSAGLYPPTPSIGVNGTFFSTKRPYHLASLVYFNGKKYGEFPASETKVRGGLVCYKDGVVEGGYFSVEGGKLLWNGKELDFGKVKWALTGGGLFLLEGKVFRASEVSKKEKLSLYITTHRHYSYIAVRKDRKTIVIGVSKGKCSPFVLASKYRDEYYAFLRLDGGSQTFFWRGKPPRKFHNAVGFAP